MLTYSCPTSLDDHPITSKEELQQFLQTITKYKGSVVCKELHESGKPHYHAAVEFEPKLTTRNMRTFDFKGVHPNIGTKDNWKKIIAYVTKETDWIAHNVDVDQVLKLRKTADKTAAQYSEAIKLAQQGKVADGMALLREADPIRFVTAHAQIQSGLQAAYAAEVAAKNPIKIIEENWTGDAQNIDINHINIGEDYVRTHILVGDAGIGKTQLAKFLLRKAGCQKIAVIRQIEQLKAHITTIDGFVYDECNINCPEMKSKGWDRERAIALFDRVEESSLPARYGDVIIPAHVKRIITTNMIDRALDTQDAAIQRRVTIHYLGDKKLFQL